MAEQLKKILMLIDTSRGSGRTFLKGIEHYISTGISWQIIVPPAQYMGLTDFDPLQWSTAQNPDGIIVFGYHNNEPLKKLAAWKVILQETTSEDLKTSTIQVDSTQIAQMAFGYLADRGFRHYAFCSGMDLGWAQTRRQQFFHAVTQAGFHFYEFQFSLTKQDQITQIRHDMGNWLKELPKPTAIFTCNDDIGIFTLEACKTASIHVPDEVSVLGVDNDELICRLSTPSLSSVQLDLRRCGYLAAAHLNQLILGQKKPEPLCILPSGIISRRSTDTLATEDPVIRESLIYIHSNFQHRIAVADVAHHVAVSRNTLEIKFKKLLNKSVADELTRLRIDMLKEKLLNLDLSINNIAASLEFTSPEHFSRFFKNAVGLTPNQYRKKHRFL